MDDTNQGTEPASRLHVTDKDIRMRNTTLVAQVGLMFASILAGASVVATRAIVDDVPPLSLAVPRFGQGALILTLCLADYAPDMLRVRRQDLPLLALRGLLLYAIFPLALKAGLRWTDAHGSTGAQSGSPCVRAQPCRATLTTDGIGLLRNFFHRHLLQLVQIPMPMLFQRR